ncbi:hypothetical protein SAMN02910339_01652 [Lachnospiraceae bacterium YSD2013]|nr:hypothetical protein SAMN02910339_01652 [Lachnospiraceae bacterium YSD2013]
MTYEELILLSRILLGAGIAFFILCLVLFIKLNIPAVIGDFSGITAKKAIKQYNADSAGMANAIYRGTGDFSRKGATSQKLAAKKAKGKDTGNFKTEKIYTAELAAPVDDEQNAKAAKPVKPVKPVKPMKPAKPAKPDKKAQKKSVADVSATPAFVSPETSVLDEQTVFNETAVLAETPVGETAVLNEIPAVNVSSGIGETEVLSTPYTMGETEVLSTPYTMGETTVLSDIELNSLAEKDKEYYSVEAAEEPAEFEVEIDITFVHSSETINI